MKMLRIIVALLAVASMSMVAHADRATVNTPKNEKGAEPHPLYGGVKYARIASTTETLVCSGRCLLADIIMSTGVSTTRVQIRDTGTADGGGTRMFPWLNFVPDNTNAARKVVNTPLRSTSGISAQLSSVGANEEVYIGYIGLGEGN